MDLIPIPEAQKDKNAGTHNHECLICGKKMSEAKAEKAWHVEMTTGLLLVPQGRTLTGDEQSQGCFPIGSECAKRVPKGYLFKF